MEYNLSYIEEEFIGKTFNENLNEKIQDYLCERKFSALGYVPRPGAIAMVHTLDESGGIKELGGSIPGDIINNNFGKWLAAMHAPVNGGANNPLNEIGPGQPPVNISGNPIVGSYFYNTSNSSYTGFTSGFSQIQIGQGLTAPLITDFDTETPFVGGPEANLTTISAGAYNPSAARVTTGVNIGPTTQAGNVSEVSYFHNWRSGGLFMISHDAVGSVPFILGETIFVQYLWQL